MNLPSFRPLNTVEKLLVKARNGDISLPEVIEHLIKTKLFVPSLEKVPVDGGKFSPLLFERDGVSMAAVFTDKSRANLYREKIQDLVVVSFSDILNNIPENYGLVMNPGYSEGLELLPHGIQNIRRDFLSS